MYPFAPLITQRPIINSIDESISRLFIFAFYFSTNEMTTEQLKDLKARVAALRRYL